MASAGAAENSPAGAGSDSSVAGEPPPLEPLVPEVPLPETPADDVASSERIDTAFSGFASSPGAQATAPKAREPAAITAAAVRSAARFERVEVRGWDFMHLTVGKPDLIGNWPNL